MQWSTTSRFRFKLQITVVIVVRFVSTDCVVDLLYPQRIGVKTIARSLGPRFAVEKVAVYSCKSGNEDHKPEDLVVPGVPGVTDRRGQGSRGWCASEAEAWARRTTPDSAY